MDIARLERLLGTGLLQDGPFGEVIRETFPEASTMDLYGASVSIDSETLEPVAITCAGRTVKL